MQRRREIALVAVSVCVFVIALAVGHLKRCFVNYQCVEIGMTRLQVEELLGPDATVNADRLLIGFPGWTILGWEIYQGMFLVAFDETGQSRYTHIAPIDEGAWTKFKRWMRM